jgi:hypothetical protein
MCYVATLGYVLTFVRSPDAFSLTTSDIKNTTKAYKDRETQVTRVGAVDLGSQTGSKSPKVPKNQIMSKH